LKQKKAFKFISSKKKKKKININKIRFKKMTDTVHFANIKRERRKSKVIALS
jgi:hypothetical protein